MNYVIIAGVIGVLGLTSSATAQVEFFYDPATGNVSFDTSNTDTGVASAIGLEIFPAATQIRFDTDSRTLLSNTSFFDSTPTVLAGATLGEPWQGLYTVGNVLPTQLSEEDWSSLFVSPNGNSQFLELFGLGTGSTQQAQFRYGRPDGEFNNRDDLLAPESINWANEATLLYKPSGGDVILDTTGPNGGYVSAFSLTSPHENQFENFISPAAASRLQVDSNGIAFFAESPLAAGIYNLGSLLPHDLSESDVATFFDRAAFLTTTGQGDTDLDFLASSTSFKIAISPTSIPEPTSVCFLLGMTTACLSQHRQRTIR